MASRPCGEAFRPYSPVLANLAGPCYSCNGCPRAVSRRCCPWPRCTNGISRPSLWSHSRSRSCSAHARALGDVLLGCYNYEHRHRGIGLHTRHRCTTAPPTRCAPHRAATLDAAYAADPTRFRRRLRPPDCPNPRGSTNPAGRPSSKQLTQSCLSRLDIFRSRHQTPSNPLRPGPRVQSEPTRSAAAPQPEQAPQSTASTQARPPPSPWTGRPTALRSQCGPRSVAVRGLRRLHRGLARMRRPLARRELHSLRCTAAHPSCLPLRSAPCRQVPRDGQAQEVDRSQGPTHHHPEPEQGPGQP